MTAPKLLWTNEAGDLRIVEMTTAGHRLHVEARIRPDALGTERWEAVVPDFGAEHHVVERSNLVERDYALREVTRELVRRMR